MSSKRWPLSGSLAPEGPYRISSRDPREQVSRNHQGGVFKWLTRLPAGKTKTIVELVLQILSHHEDSHILLTAPSNPAADTLTLRLMAYLDNKTMLRLQSSTRTFAETPNEVLTYSCIKDDTFAGKPLSWGVESHPSSP
jgi:hypothetical protein